MTAFAAARTTPGWFTADDCRLEDFRAVVETTTDLADYPHADEVRENVLVYGPGLREHTATAARRRDVQAELARALADGPGIVVLAGAFPDTGVVDRATAVFEAMIAEQKAAGVAGGDHFATPGANDRVWGALDKFAVRNPEAFAAYYGNDAIALVSEAWLGRGYQVTSQVNVVNPGGKAQVAHRDYHLGFMSEEQALAFPAHVHRLSPVMTLQGAVAHCDMPVETGPTMYLPHSQKYAPATSPSTSRSSPPTSTSTSCSCRCRGATPRSSTRRCSTALAPTARPTCAAWPTCCRCPRRSAGQWKR